MFMIDTQMERNYLMLEAYPFLRKLCLVLGLEFRVVDMRWGVREERRSFSYHTFIPKLYDISVYVNIFFQ